jgi:hypothetical protein
MAARPAPSASPTSGIEVADNPEHGASEVPNTEPETVAKPSRPRSRPGHRHPNTLANLKRNAGPGRPKGSRNKFSQEAIARFVDQYRNDLAADWDKHGEQFIAKCREMFPQIYATMQRMRIEDELSRVQNNAGPITIQWAATESAPPPQTAEPPRQIPYKPPEMPADLKPQDWSVLMQVLEQIKRTIPSNSDAPPAEVFEVIRKALLAHFADK